MAIIGAIVDIPDITTPSALPVVSDGSAAKTTHTLAVGESTGVAGKLSTNAAMADAGLLYSGLPRIARGLTISVTSLTATVAAGVALAQGVLVLEAPVGSIAVLDDATNFLWLRQTTPGATPEVIVSDTSPTPGSVFLGAAVIAAGVTTIDTSGVLYARSGLPWREVSDSVAPTDDPGAWALLTKTGSGLYLWDGDAHYKLVSGGASGTVSLAAVTGGGTAGSLTVVDGIITAIVAPT